MCNVARHLDAPEASMGPLLFRAEDLELEIGEAVIDSASMGPLLFRAEDCRVPRGSCVGRAASMGPLLFRAEDEKKFSAGVLVGEASMGPLLFRAEDSPGPKSRPPEPLLLQWGRSCSERKTSACTMQAFRNTFCFNGAALVQSGRLIEQDDIPNGVQRFNGAALVQSGRRTVACRRQV